MHHLSASIFYSRQPNGGRDRRSAAFRNAFSPRRPSSRPIRIEGEEADHCLAKQRAGLLVSSINPRLSASDGQQWERRLVMRETSIHPTLDSSFKKKKKIIPHNIRRTLFFPLKWNVIFYSIRGGKFSFANDVLESSSNIWRTSCLPNRVSTLCCIYFAI